MVYECPNCHKKLKEKELVAKKCFSCGASFEEDWLSEVEPEENDDSQEDSFFDIKEEEKESHGHGAFSFWYTALGFLVVCFGVIVGIASFSQETVELPLGYMVLCIAVGLLLIAAGKIVTILDEIKIKLEKDEDQ